MFSDELNNAIIVLCKNGINFFDFHIDKLYIDENNDCFHLIFKKKEE